MLRNKIMNALDYIANKFKLDMSTSSPIEIPNVGRANLAEWLHDLDFKVGVEVGVGEGEYSEIICKANPQMKLYGVDCYEPYNGYADCQSTEEFSMSYEEAIDRLSKFPKYIFVKKLSMDALRDFADGSLDFVYIDANHTNPFVTQDVEGWSKKVRLGGIVSGHDYIDKRRWGVKEAVNNYVNHNHIKHWFILGLQNKISGTVTDYSVSWMWIKK